MHLKNYIFKNRDCLLKYLESLKLWHCFRSPPVWAKIRIPPPLPPPTHTQPPLTPPPKKREKTQKTHKTETKQTSRKKTHWRMFLLWNNMMYIYEYGIF